MIIKKAFENLFKIREEAAKSRPGADNGYDPYEKPFLDHLEDLRVTLFKMLMTLLGATSVIFIFNKQIFHFVQLPAKRATLEDGSSLWDRLDFITLSPPDVLMLMLKLSFFTGIVIAFPFLIYFLFQFILPGLRQVEKKTIIPGALVGFFLFLIGASFAFLLAAPIALKFFYSFQNERVAYINPSKQALDRNISEVPLLGLNGDLIKPVKEGEKPEEGAAPAQLTPELKQEIRGYMLGLFATQRGSNYVFRHDEIRDKLVLVYSKGGTITYGLGQYFGFITRLTLVFGLAFQLPVVVTILVKLELLTARVMRSTRTYAWVIIMVGSAILTPPDLVTLALLAGPVIVLYEICVIIASIIEKGREKKALAEEKARRARLEQLYSRSPEDLSEDEKTELHKHEIEQYEKDHANLEHSDHDHLVEHDPYHDEHHGEDHDSWHDDHHYYHEDHDDYHDDHHEDHEAGDDKASDEEKQASDEESDSAEAKEDSSESDPADSKPESGFSDEDDYSFEDDDCCEPEGPVVDMNHAPLEELMTLPDMTDDVADAIIQNRPYETFDDLERVDGVGAENIDKWIERLMIG
ncbi:MAG: twin-arginine translocase subunit TatC [Verrucomicrobiota bacterium]